MIVTVILNLFALVLSGFLIMLPNGTLPTAIATAFTYFVNSMNAFSFFIPVDTLLQAAGIILIFDGALMVWHFINWIIRKIPGMQ